MSNCFLYAFSRWWRHGGYIVLRRSNWGWWPHVLWTADLKVFFDYGPQRKARYKFPRLLFRGTVRRFHASDKCPPPGGCCGTGR